MPNSVFVNQSSSRLPPWLRNNKNQLSFFFLTKKITDFHKKICPCFAPAVYENNYSKTIGILSEHPPNSPHSKILPPLFARKRSKTNFFLSAERLIFWKFTPSWSFWIIFREGVFESRYAKKLIKFVTFFHKNLSRPPVNTFKLRVTFASALHDDSVRDRFRYPNGGKTQSTRFTRRCTEIIFATILVNEKMTE